MLLFTRHHPARCFRAYLHENPEGCSAKRRSLPFLCIAERVTGHGVNSNRVTLLFTRHRPAKRVTGHEIPVGLGCKSSNLLELSDKIAQVIKTHQQADLKYSHICGGQPCTGFFNPEIVQVLYKIPSKVLLKIP